MKQEGYALVITLMLIFIISLIISTVFYTGILEYQTSNNNVANNLAFQAAENSIKKNLTNLQVSKGDLNQILAISKNEKKYCINASGDLINDTCDSIFINEDKTIKSGSIITRRTGECAAFGSSDQTASCFNIEGIGQIPAITLKLSNMQEIKINTINASGNGVYEY